MGNYLKTKDLVDYLLTMDQDSDAIFLAVDVEARKKYPVKSMVCITDLGYPAICLEVSGEVPFDEMEIQTAEECEADDQESGDPEEY